MGECELVRGCEGAGECEVTVRRDHERVRGGNQGTDSVHRQTHSETGNTQFLMKH